MAVGRQAFDDFEKNMDGLAGLRAGLVNDVERIPGSRLLPGKFTSVQQAIGTPKGRNVSINYRREFVADAKASGFVDKLFDQFGVTGLLTVAP